MDKKLIFVFIIVLITIVYAQTPVAVMDFRANSLSKGEVKALTDRLRNELFSYKQFDLMERAYMEEILDEQGFQLSGCTSDECVVEAGKLIGVQQIIGGSVSQVGKTFTVAARIISIETGKIVKTASYDFTGEIDNLLKEGMKHIAAQLAGIDPKIIEYGNISITSNVPKTKIYIENSLYGNSPILNQKYEVGTYNFSFQKKYFNPIDTIINVTKNDQKRLNVQMFPRKDEIKSAITKYTENRKNCLIGATLSICSAFYLLESADKHYEEYQTAGKNATSLHEQIIKEEIMSAVMFGVGSAFIVPTIKYTLDIGKLNKYLLLDTDQKNDAVKLSFEVKI